MTDVRLTATNPEDSSVVPVACNAKGLLKLEEPIVFDGNLDGDLSVTGAASFSDEVEATYFKAVNTGIAYLQPNTVTAFQAYESSGPATINLGNDGTGEFKGELKVAKNIRVGGNAADKAGFTEEGYLWCTTRRGDTVILDATSNGLGTWADYTPPTRREQAEERIDALKEAKREERDGSDIS